MLTQYRHVEFNESFTYPVHRHGKMYTKHNHGRAKLDPKHNGNVRPVYIRIPKNAIVETAEKATPETQYMVAKKHPACCKNPHTIPFDNDQTCTNCGTHNRKHNA
jgi:hypothetical protein